MNLRLSMPSCRWCVLLAAVTDILLLVYFGRMIAVGTLLIMTVMNVSTLGTVSQYAITTSIAAVAARMRCSSMLRTMYSRCPVCGQAPKNMKP